MAFLEDRVLNGLLAARGHRGLQNSLTKAAPLLQAQEQAKVAADKRQAEEIARTFPGLRGSMPTLRRDLLQLATLLKVEIEAKARRGQGCLPAHGAGLDGQAQIPAVVRQLRRLQGHTRLQIRHRPTPLPAQQWHQFQALSDDHTGSAQASDGTARREVPGNAGESEPIHFEVQATDGRQSTRVAELGRRGSDDGGWNPWSIKIKVKPGLGLMITQAWKQH